MEMNNAVPMLMPETVAVIPTGIFFAVSAVRAAYRAWGMANPMVKLNVTCYSIYAECPVVGLNVVRNPSSMAIMVDSSNM
jgi:hypothetical protein